MTPQASYSIRNPGIIPSDDPGEALSVTSRHRSIQACKGIRDPLNPMTTMHKRHRQTDTDIVAYVRDVPYILHLVLK